MSAATTSLRGGDLARAVLAHIEAHPETWSQGNWAIRTDCGTAFCFAGWTVALSGGKFVWNASEIEDVDEEASYVTGVPGTAGAPSIGWAAAKLLGLVYDPLAGCAAHLFAGENTLDDLRDMVAEFWPVDGAR